MPNCPKHGPYDEFDCRQCMIDDAMMDYDDDDCFQCGGEGFYTSCFDEGACIDPESGCDLCTHRCDICNNKPVK